MQGDDAARREHPAHVREAGRRQPGRERLRAGEAPHRAREVGVGVRIARDPAEPEAYTYLPSSVKRFPDPQALGGELVAAGLTDVRWILTAGGIIALHAGVRV